MNQTTDFIKQGIQAKLIRLTDADRIEYVFEQRSRNFRNHEEKVQAEA